MDISNIGNDIARYFWSINSKDELVCGGYNNGNSYGHIEIAIDDEQAIIYRTIGDGTSTSMMLSPQPYSKLTKEYNDLCSLRERVEDYLKEAGTSAYQDLHRESLMRNVRELLPS